MQTLFIEREISYTGVELRPHYLLSEFGLKGSAIGAFMGPCRVETEHLVDWEDRLASDRIEAARMLHFIGEFFGTTLEAGVLRQRLFMATAAEILREKWAVAVRREGDDLFVAEQKLSVSIVTSSPVSQLLHVGMNIDPTGAPVPAVGLAALEVDPRSFGEQLLVAWSRAEEELLWACAKVRPVV